MRFARIEAADDGVPAGLAELAAAGNLDLLQLDYRRPRRATVRDHRAVELPEFAAGFLPALEALRKSLFLEPSLCVAASAGWGSSYACVEAATAVLIEGGCGDVLVSAVRGSNLLPILDDLASTGVKLDNVETGAKWREQRFVPLAADLQLGAGPLATALAEGARVVVAGCYDAASPAAARAVRDYGWAWADWHRLAGVAMAAQAASWSSWRGPQWFLAAAREGAWVAHPRIDLDESGEFTVELNCTAETADCRELVQWLRHEDGRQAHADVSSNTSQVTASTSGASQLTVQGARGSKPDGLWRLEVLYQSGFAAKVLVEFLPAASTTVRERLAEAVGRHFAEADDLATAVTPLTPTAVDAGDGVGWLHVAARSPSAAVCQQFVEQMAAFVAANAGVVRYASEPPRTYVDCEIWPAAIPRDAVDIAVDTRPAREWV